MARRYTYNTNRILTPNITLDEAAYKAYSPLFVPPAFSLTYAFSFANLLSSLTHLIMYYGKDICPSCQER